MHDVGVVIGDRPRVTGLRLNFRDRELEEVALGLFGVAAGERLDGVAVAPAYLRVTDDGSFRGGAVGAFNRVAGTQRVSRSAS